MKKMHFFLLLMSCLSANAYDIMDRFILFEDRLKILEELNPYGDDFVLPLDIYAAVSPDSMELKDDAEKAKNLSLAQANELIQKYDKTEHIVHLKPINLNVRLPRFNLFEFHFVPALRVESSFGLMVGIRTENIVINGNTILLFVPSSVQSQLSATTLNYIKTKSYAGGDPIMANDAECTTAGVADPIVCEVLKRYKVPSANSPVLRSYLKAEAKAGFHFNYYSPAFKLKGDDYFYGEFFPYFSMRSDYKVFAATDTLIAGANPIEDYKPSDQTQNYIFVDYRIGYQSKPYNMYIAIEELKIMEGGDDTKKIAFENDPLIKVHGDADFTFSVLKLQPFAGFHFRSNYSVSDGAYVGLQAGFSFWEDRFKLLPKAILDKEYFTLGLNLKLWIMYIDPYAKVAVKSEIDGVKSPDIFGINLRVVQF